MNEKQSLRFLLDRADLVLCKAEQIFMGHGRGIGVLLSVCESGEDWSGCSAADKIVGKAAALLFADLHAKDVYGEVMSDGAIEVFERFGIRYSFGTRCVAIINRSGDGICPMERTVAEIGIPAEARIVLRQKLDSLTNLHYVKDGELA